MSGIDVVMPQHIGPKPVYIVREIDHDNYENSTYYDANELDNAEEMALEHAKESWDKGEGGFKYVSVIEITMDTDGTEVYTIIFERDYSYGPDVYPEDFD